MVQYATPEELASYLQQDLDTASATQALTIASGLFARRARTSFAATTATYVTDGTTSTRIELPYRPVIAVSAIRVNGVALPVDYALRRHSVYRLAGFGEPWAFPPDVVEIDYTYGYTAVPDDVKGAVLETAAAIYEHPDGSVVSESIDDYSARYSGNGGGVRLTPAAEKLADYYRGVLVA